MSARTDRHGCPSWCGSSHVREDSRGSGRLHVADFQPSVRLTGDRSGAEVYVSLAQEYDVVNPCVTVEGYVPGASGTPYLQVPVAAAGFLAGLVGFLARATPEEHGRIAAALRDTAAGADKDGGQE